MSAAALLLAAMLSATAPAGAKPCPAIVGLSRSGTLYEQRGGAWVRQSTSVVRDVLRNGCYPEGGPSPTSSVTLFLEPGASAANVSRTYTLLESAGWPKGKVDTRIWKNAPRAPRETP